MQELDLPHGSAGLGWIVAQGPLQLLLIPGLKPASIVAAAAGDQDALAYLRFAAQHFAALGSTQSLTEFDKLCIEASAIRDHPRFFCYLQQHESREAANLYQAWRGTMETLLYRAVCGAHLDALKWLQALCHRFCGDDVALMRAAAQNGDLSILKYLRSGPNVAPWDSDVTEAAVSNIEALVWLILQEPKCPCRGDIVELVADIGNLDALMKLRAASRLPLDWWDEDVCIAAARSGNLAMLQWLRGLDPAVPWDSNLPEEAALRGDISMLRWARAQVPPVRWTETTSVAAARQGNIPLLDWLFTQDPPCFVGSSAVDAAAEHGHLDVLRWLEPRLSPVVFTARTACAAAGQPDLDMLQYLRSKVPPCPWDESCTASAAAHGNLPMLQWIHAQQTCPMDKSITLHAARRGDVPMLEWATRQDFAYLWDGQMYYEAACNGHPQTLRWLYRKGITAPRPVDVGIHDLSYRRSHYSLHNVSTPILMYLGDIGAALPAVQHHQLMLARRTFCMFHGLLRWCRRAVSNPSLGIHQAFNELLPDASGQHLLVNLSLLPPELLTRIAVAAELQHDII